MPSTRAWLAFTAALALAAPLGALADPQRQQPAAPRSSFTNFDILKQLVKDHHAQTGKTVQARRGAGVVSRLGSFLDANAVRRRRLLGGAPPDVDAQAASSPQPPPSPPPPSPPPRGTPLLDQLAQLLDRNASAPIFPQAGPGLGLDTLLNPPNLTALLAPLSAQGGLLQPFSGPPQLPDGPIHEQLAALLGNLTDPSVFPQAGPGLDALLTPPNWTDILGPLAATTPIRPFSGLPQLPEGPIREQLAALLGNLTDPSVFPQSGPSPLLGGGGLINPPNWTELANLIVQPFAGPNPTGLIGSPPNWTQILEPFRGAGLSIPDGGGGGAMDGAIRNQLLALLGNALAGGGGDAGVFPMIGGGDAGVFPMSAGNWLQLVTAAATGNSQQLFSTLAGNAIRNQLLGLLGGALGGDGAGAGGGVFAQSGPGSSIFPSTDSGSLLDVWGSLSDGLGGGDASGIANVLPLLVAAVAGATGGDGAVLAQSGDGAAPPPAWLNSDWTLNLPQWPATPDANSGDGLRERLASLFTHDEDAGAPAFGSPLFDGSLLAQSGEGDRAPPAWLDPDWSLLGSPGATPGTALAADAFLTQLLDYYSGAANGGGVAAQSGEEGGPAPPPFDATRPAGGDGWFVSDWTLLGRLAALANENEASGGSAEEAAGEASGGALRSYLAGLWEDTWFSQILTSVMRRRADAQQPPSPPPSGPSGSPSPPAPSPRGPVAAVPTYPPSYPEGPPRPPFPDSATTASFGGPPSGSVGSHIDSIVANLRNPDGSIDPATVSDVAAVLATLAGVNLTDADFDNAVAIAVAAGLAGMREGSDDQTGSNDANDHHHHEHRKGHFNATGGVQRYRDMFGTALRAAGDFVEESFASANSGADADGSVGGKDSAEVESLVAAAIKVAEENAAHFIDLGVGDEGAEGAEGADSGEAVDVDTAIELLDRVQGVLAAARGDFHAALDQSQQGAGVKAPGAPDGYLTAAQLLTLMGGMGARGGGGLASGLPVDEDVGDPTVPGTKFPFNATDNTEELGNIADKVADDPLGYLNGLIDDLINPNRDGGDGGGDAMVGAQSGPNDDAVRTDPPAVDVSDTVSDTADDGSPAAKFFEKTETQVAIPVAAVVLAGGIFAAYTSGLSGRLFGRGASGAEGSGNAGNGRMLDAAGEADGASGASGASTAVSAGGGRIVRRTSTSTKIEMSGSTASSNGGGGGGGGLASVRRGFRDLTSRAGRSAAEARPIRGEKAAA